MDKFRYRRCGVSWFAIRYCDYLCAIGDWTRDYGASSGDDLDFVFENLANVNDGLFFVANPAIRAKTRLKSKLYLKKLIFKKKNKLW